MKNRRAPTQKDLLAQARLFQAQEASPEREQQPMSDLPFLNPPKGKHDTTPKHHSKDEQPEPEPTEAELHEAAITLRKGQKSA